MRASWATPFLCNYFLLIFFCNHVNECELKFGIYSTSLQKYAYEPFFSNNSLLISHGWLQSTGSFFHDNSITLGSLIGISSFLELSRRSTRGRMVEPSKDNKRIHKLKPWLFSLCSRLSTDAVIGNDAPSLGHYLEAERRAASTYRRNQCPTTYGPNGFSPIQDSTSLLVRSQIDHWPSASLGGEHDLNREMEE